DRRGISGPDRAMLYRIALGTGFRAAEIASLVPASFNLDDDPPTVTVKAGYSKNRKLAVQPIRRDLAELLRPWVAARPDGRPVFDVANLTFRTAAIVRADLEAAGIAYRDEDGRVADLHSLRHTYVTAVRRARAAVKEAPTLAGRGSPELTFGVYAHARVGERGRPLEGMPATPGAVAASRDGKQVTEVA